MSQRRTNKGDPAKAIAYLRVSTEEQVAGLEGQRHELARWAASKGLRIVAVFEDKDVSGATPLAERPGLQAAIAALRAHKAGALVAAKRDRFARDPKLMEALEYLVHRRGARLRNVDEVELDGPTGEFVRSMLDQVAKLERGFIRQRTSAALRALQASGRAAGGRPPYGFSMVRVPDDSDRGFHHELREAPTEQAGLRLMQELDAQGLSWAEIARRLHAAGIAPRGQKWHPKSVERVLRRRQSHVSPDGRPE
jgi:DNA invertase Pin-like site-specific DNA recombinase